MSTLKLVGWLRRFRIWFGLRRTYSWVSKLLAGFIHSIVVRLGPELVSQNLWLKHTYDYETVYIDPRRIDRLVRVGGWRALTESPSLIDRFRAWFRYGDGLKSVRTHVTRNFHGHFSADGDWDRARSFEVLPVITQLFEQQMRPRETAEYQRYLQRINDGQLIWTRGCRNQAELDAYYDALIRAYEDIKVNGYRTQSELGESGVDEIRVCIDRYGGVGVYGGGTHRLSIARILELERIPVTVKRIHSAWIESISVPGVERGDGIRQGLLGIGIQTNVPKRPMMQGGDE